MNNLGSANLGSANLGLANLGNAAAANVPAVASTPANSPSLGEQLGEQPATLLNANSVNQQNSPPPLQPEAMPENQGMPAVAEPIAEAIVPPAPAPAPPAPAPAPQGKKTMTEGQAKLQADRAETLRLMREEYRKVFGDDKKAPKAKVANAARLTTVRLKQGNNAFMTALYDDYITRNQGKQMNEPRKTMKKRKNVPEARPIAPIAPPAARPMNVVAPAEPTESRVVSPSKESKAEIQKQIEHLLQAVHKQAVEDATRRVRRIMKAAGASSTTIHHMSKMIMRGKESHAAAFLRSACASHSPLTSPKTAKKRIFFANRKK